MIALLPRFFAWGLFAACQLGLPAFSATHLLGAALDNDREGVIRFLESGAEVNQRGPMGASPLHWAAFHGNEQMVGILLDAGARLDVTLDNGSTPLHLAAYKGHTRVAQLLSARGADPLAKTLDGVTPIAWARHKGHEQLAALLSARASAVETGLSQTDAMPVLQEPMLPGQPTEPTPPAKPEPETRTPPEPAGVPETGVSEPPSPMFRVQLVAMSSEEGARREIGKFHDRYPEVLREVRLDYEAMKGVRGPMYRVLSEPLPASRAGTLCEQLKRRDQSCLLRRVK